MNTYYVPAFGLDDNLQCSDDHFYLRCIFLSVPYTYTNSHTHTHIYIYLYRAFLVANLIKNSPAVPETLVRFLGQKDPLEKG